MNRTQILHKFKQGLLSFFDELIEQFPQEGDLVIIRIFINDQVPIEDVMEHFINHILPLKPIVKKRDDKFFLDNHVLFQELTKSKVDYFKKVWQSNALDSDDREVCFKWFDMFIMLAEKYQDMC